MVQKLCATTRNSLDSIFISAFIGLNAVAIYNNYYTILNAIVGVMSIFSGAITAGIGNSIVTETVDKNYRDMNKFNFIYMWIAGWCTICLVCLYQPFMELWMGQEYMFPLSMVILFCIYFYSLKMGDIRAAYSDAKGLWWENRYRAVAETITNIILNWILVQIWGIYGIIIATLISLLVINFAYGSQLLFKYYFTNQKFIDYFKYHGIYALVTGALAIVTYYICSLIKLDGIIELVVKGSICVIIPNILYILIYRKSSMFKEATDFIKNYISKMKKA